MQRLVISVFLIMLSGVVWTQTGAIEDVLSRVVIAQDERDAMQGALAQYGACELRIVLTDAQTGEIIPGLVRVRLQGDSDSWLPITGLIPRVNQGWHVLTEATTILVPQQPIRIEAIQGLETELALVDVDLRGQYDRSLDIPLTRFYDTHQQGLLSANTHLHVENITRPVITIEQLQRQRRRVAARG